MAPIILILAGAVLHLEFVAMRHLQRSSLAEAQSVAVTVPARSLEDALIRTAAELRIMFDLRACRFESFPFDALLPRIEQGRITLPTPEAGVAPCSFSGVELPVRNDTLTLGRFVLVPTAPSVGVVFSPTLRDRAIAMAAELGAPLAAALARGDLLASRAYDAAEASAQATRATSAHSRSRS